MKTKPRILRNKKGTPDFIMWALLFTFGIALIVFLSHYVEKTSDYSRPIGQAAVDIVLMSQEAEKTLLYIDLSAKLGLLQTIVDMGSRGGYYDEPLCQSFGGFMTWKKSEQSCLPDNKVIDESFNQIMNNNLDEHLSQYPELALPFNNYVFSRSQENELMTIRGIAMQNIMLNIGEGEWQKGIASDVVYTVPASAKGMIEKIHNEYGQTIMEEKTYLGQYDKVFEKRFFPSDSLLAGIIAQESSGNPNVVSWSGCAGLLQFCYNTAKDLSEKYAKHNIELFPQLTPCGCISSRCTSGTEKCNYMNDNRIGAENVDNSIRAGIILLYENINMFRSEREKEKLAVAAYNGGPGVIRCAVKRAKRQTGEILPSWEDVSRALSPECITYFDSQKDKENKVNEIRGYVTKVFGYKQTHEQFLVEQEKKDREDPSGLTGNAIYDMTGISDVTGMGMVFVESPNLEQKQKKKASGYTAHYSIKPSFTTRVEYDFDRYEDFFNKMTLIEKECGSELTPECVYDKVIGKPATGAEYNLAPDGSGMWWKSWNDWIIRYDDSFLTRNSVISPVSEELLWAECNSEPEMAIDDFLTFFQNCYYSESTGNDGCYCNYPESLMSASSKSFEINIVESEEEADAGYTNYEAYLYGNPELYNRKFTVPSTYMMPTKVEIEMISEKRYAIFTFKDASGKDYEIEGSYLNLNDIRDIFFLYKDSSGLTFAKKDYDDNEFRPITSVENYKINADVKDFSSMERCEPASVLKVCVVDTKQKYLVYDALEDKTGFHYPTVKFSYFVKDTKAPPPVTGIYASDARYKEDAVILKWDKSPATDTESYRIYYAEQGVDDYFTKQPSTTETGKNRATRKMIDVHNDEDVKNITIVLKETRQRLVNGDVKLDRCEFNYAERTCFHTIEQDGKEKVIALEEGTLYNFIVPGEKNYYVYVIKGPKDGKVYDVGVTAIDGSNNELQNGEEVKVETATDETKKEEHQMIIINAEPVDDLAPDLVEFDTAQSDEAKITFDGNIQLKWNPVDENLDKTEATDVEGYYIYSSACVEPTKLEQDMLEGASNPVNPQLFTDTTFEKSLAQYTTNPCTKTLDGSIKQFDIYYVFIARDDDNNPEISFDEALFKTWKDYGLSIVKVSVEPYDIPPNPGDTVTPRKPLTDILILPEAPVPLEGEKADEILVLPGDDDEQEDENQLPGMNCDSHCDFNNPICTKYGVFPKMTFKSNNEPCNAEYNSCELKLREAVWIYWEHPNDIDYEYARDEESFPSQINIGTDSPLDLSTCCAISENYGSYYGVEGASCNFGSDRYAFDYDTWQARLME